MAIDPPRLKPTEAVRLLNPTPLGEVISERQDDSLGRLAASSRHPDRVATF